MNSYSSRLNNLIPGGCHTYSRGDDQFPANAPQILTRGKGAHVWCPERKYLDYGMGLRAITLGYADERVNSAAIEQINNGNNLTRASAIELAAAETMLDLIPGAEMVKFAKNGSNVTTAAVKLARAYTGKKYVARCSQHPFFSFDDWFIGNTVIKKGVPKEVQDLTLRFEYNNRKSVDKLFEESNDIAALILEPASIQSPCISKDCDLSSRCKLDKTQKCKDEENFLQYLRRKCDENNCVFILDEMVTGFRWHLSGFSISALCGKKEIMSLGGIQDAGSERTFLLSTTHGAEMSSLGAFIETVKIYQEKNVVDHMWSYGRELKERANQVSSKLGLKDCFYIDGFDCSPYFVTNNKLGSSCFKMRTIFCQEMIKAGVLMPWISVSLSHGKEELEKTLGAIEESLKLYADALESPDKFVINDHVLKPVFRKFN